MMTVLTVILMVTVTIVVVLQSNGDSVSANGKGKMTMGCQDTFPHLHLSVFPSCKTPHNCNTVIEIVEVQRSSLSLGHTRRFLHSSSSDF